ncbi:MAG: 50S ribosomal protein L17 [Desulfobacteraceae bacterium]|nr:MAG: 50S ribosomal protein L17 [Desulfobacteraceae bacterium]
MRHRKAGIKLGRTTSHRNAMFRNMVTSLFKYDRIRTTDAKAKELRRLADNIVTLAKRGDLHARRQALSIVREKSVIHKLFEEIQDKFGSVAGGYTRIVRLGRRPGDSAPVSLVELISSEPSKKMGGKKKKPAGAEKKKGGAPPVSGKKEEKASPAAEPDSERKVSGREETKSEASPTEEEKKESTPDKSQ